MRSRLPSRSPTTALIWARASRIETILPVCDSQAKTPSRSSAASAARSIPATAATRRAALAAFVGGPAEVTLRLPPPLDRPLTVAEEDGRVLLARRRGAGRRGASGRARRRRTGRRDVRGGGGGGEPPRALRRRELLRVLLLRRPAGRRPLHQPRRGARDAICTRRPGSRTRSRPRWSGPRSTAPARTPSAGRAAARSCSAAWPPRSTACPRRASAASSSPGRSARTGASCTPARRCWAADGEPLAAARQTWIQPRNG